MGRRRREIRGEAVDGILLLDKPAGITSNGALQDARKLLHARKAGHTGSLDPIATGLLPLCFGKTTRWSGYFLGSDKHYKTRIRLGESTDTGDCEGKIVSQTKVAVTEQQLFSALDSFRGRYTQIPPMYSAIKVNGQPLYKLARQGKEIEREGREVVVKSLKVLSFDGRNVELELVCTSGFYVRSLAHDLGQALSVGGHVAALRRLGVAGLRVENAVTLEELGALADPAVRRRKLCAVDQSLIHLPAVELSVDAAFYLCRGQAVRVRNLPPKGNVRLYSGGAGFLGIGSVSGQDTVTPERLSGGEVKTG